VDSPRPHCKLVPHTHAQASILVTGLLSIQQDKCAGQDSQIRHESARKVLSASNHDGLLLQSHPIEAMSPALCPPARLGLQESSLTTPLVYVASGPHEVGLWDMEQSKCHQVFARATRKYANCGGTPPSSLDLEINAEGCEHDLLGRSSYIW